MFGLNARRLFLILILIAVLFAGAQYAPPFVYAFQFKDFIRQEVKYASARRKSTEDVKHELLDKAREFKIPLTDRDIHIVPRGPSFRLDLDFGWTIDLRVYQHQLKFHASENGESFER